MAVAFRSSASTAGSTATTLVFTKPAGLAVNDYMVAQMEDDGVSVSSVPTGFTLINSIDTAGSTTYRAYGKLATSSDVAASTFTFTYSGSCGHLGVISAFSGVNTVSPVGANLIANTDSNSINGTTPQQTDSIYLLARGGNGLRTFSGYAMVTSNPTWTEINDSSHSASSNICMGVAYSTVRTQATATGNLTVTASGALTGSGVHLIEIKFPDTSDKYWVGGTGTWDTTLTHWANTSGGAGGVNVPTVLTPNVFFDASSGGGTATTGATLSLGGNLIFTGYTGTFAGSNTLSLLGSLTIASGMTLSYTGAITFTATATGKTFTTAGKTILSTLTFNGLGGGWTLQDNLTSTAASITLTAGSLNFNNKDVTVPIFLSTNSNVRTLTMGSGTLTLNGTGTVWSTASNDNLTLTPGTSTIKITDASASTKTFAGGGLTYYNLWITGSGSGAYTISGSNTFNDFKVDTPPHTVNFTAGTYTTVNTFTVNGTAGNLMTLQSTVGGTPWFIVNATIVPIVCDYLSLQDSHAIS